MATTKEYKEFAMQCFSKIGNITIRPMMGEYLLYYKGLLFGGIYDSRVLVKMVDNNKKYNMEEALPYKGAKNMYLVDNIEDVETLKSVILDTCEGLSKK